VVVRQVAANVGGRRFVREPVGRDICGASDLPCEAGGHGGDEAGVAEGKCA